MKKAFLFFGISLLVFSCNNDNPFDLDEQQVCDGGTFVGEVRLSTQAEVNAFGANCYDKIDGTLYIGADSSQPTDITDLSPLETLTEIFTTGTTSIAKIWVGHNPVLPNLNGLHNITKADGLVVSSNPLLTDLSGLEGLTMLFGDGSVHDIIIGYNEGLLSLDGLENLTVVGDPNSNVTAIITIQNNDNLTNLDGLSGLDNVYGGIYIGDYNGNTDQSIGNASLTDYCGLTSLLSDGVFEEVVINNNTFNPTIQDIVDGNCSE